MALARQQFAQPFLAADQHRAEAFEFQIVGLLIDLPRVQSGELGDPLRADQNVIGERFGFFGHFNDPFVSVRRDLY